MAKTQGPTYRPKKKPRVRKLGFLKRMSKWTSRNVIKRRRSKGRAKLSVSTEFGSRVEKNKKFSRRK